MQVGNRFKMAYNKLNTPKHRIQLKKIEHRWNTLQSYVDKEEHAIMMDLQAFLSQPEIKSELQDLDNDVSREMRQMDMRYKRFEMKVNNVHGPVLERKLAKIGRKMEALDYKFKNNLKFDPETKMWKLSMDNKIDQELQQDGMEINQDLEKFIGSKPEIQKELKELDADLKAEMQDVQKELMESAKLLENPEYKAELEAIAAKMEALDAKFKANIKFEQ